MGGGCSIEHRVDVKDSKLSSHLARGVSNASGTADSCTRNALQRRFQNSVFRDVNIKIGIKTRLCRWPCNCLEHACTQSVGSGKNSDHSVLIHRNRGRKRIFGNDVVGAVAAVVANNEVKIFAEIHRARKSGIRKQVGSSSLNCG